MSYLPASADNAFLLFDVLKADEQLQRLPAHAATDRGLMQQVLEESGKWVGEVVAPLSERILGRSASEDIIHQYAHCWRCKSPILYRATDQWFCSVDAF